MTPVGVLVVQAFLLGDSAPDMTSTERVAAYKGWVYACVNAISEEVAGIDLKLQQRRGKDEWQDYQGGNATADMAFAPLTKQNM